MFLFTIEGGDGSGKGLATRIVSEILEKEFSFTSVEMTGEPRRDHDLGRLAINAVKKKKMTSNQEAGLFAADRLDHSHGWILPRLLQGMAVVSERNIHSSLVYQGIVGELGVHRVAQINSAALVPDLCIWVDCDPEIAMRRINSETLRGVSEKEEYFETTELQAKIREGYSVLLNGKEEMPTPFDLGAVIGPILNEGSEEDLRRKLTDSIRSFLHGRPTPINVSKEEVDKRQIRKMIQLSKGQSTLSGLGIDPTKNREGWLDGRTPWNVLKKAQADHKKVIDTATDSELLWFPKNILNHSMSSICGTLSLVNTADISEIRAAMGPARVVSGRHTRRIVKFLHEKLDWATQHKSLTSRDATRSQLRDEIFPFGRLSLALWPLKREISRWISANSDTHLRFCMSQIINSGENEIPIRETMERLAILGSGSPGRGPPSNEKDLSDWWLGK